MLKPRPWQSTGAEFLASRKTAGLFDAPRVGKTGASILAANKVKAETVSVITTRSGIAVWQRAFDQWGLQAPSRRLVSWGGDIRALARLRHDVLIVDESHKAGNPGSERTRAIYGEVQADGLFHREAAAVSKAERVWCLSGTPAPHDNSQWWPMIRSLAPELLAEELRPTSNRRDAGALAALGALTIPSVRGFPTFRDRYCKTAMKKVPHGPPIPVIIGGQNSAELRERLQGWFLRRTQADVGISEPTFDLLPLRAPTQAVAVVEDQALRDREARAAVIAAAETGDTRELELALGSILRITGEIKADLMWGPVTDVLEGGTDKIVLAYWHRNVGDMLEAMFAGPYGVLRLDGSTPAAERARLEGLWATGKQRIFAVQMEAGGEAIDLSPSANMIIVEPVFRPTTMRQVALRITNIQRKRTPLVRVAVLAGSIDEAIQERLLALWAPIKEVLSNA